MAVTSTSAEALAGRPEGVGTGARAVLVVCDGVTTSADSDIASLAAARAACQALADLPPAEHTGPVTQTPEDDWPESRVEVLIPRIESAGGEANAAVVAAAGQFQDRNPPSCTLVAAVVEDGVVVVGSVGDSRAYWIPDDGEPRQLTRDDSWAAERIAMGVPRQEAETGHHAHAITRWLGRDAPDTRPRIAWTQLDRPGWVLVCSDGLWNYRSEAEDLAELVRTLTGRAGAEPDPARLADDLVAWANDQGGQDNITVALARVGAHADVPGQVPDGAAEPEPEPTADTAAAPTAPTAPAAVPREERPTHG
jgi:serine/threonine protein phosphatase PrpC